MRMMCNVEEWEARHYLYDNDEFVWETKDGKHTVAAWKKTKNGITYYRISYACNKQEMATKLVLAPNSPLDEEEVVREANMLLGEEFGRKALKESTQTQLQS